MFPIDESLDFEGIYKFARKKAWRQACAMYPSDMQSERINSFFFCLATELETRLTNPHKATEEPSGDRHTKSRGNDEEDR